MLIEISFSFSFLETAIEIIENIGNHVVIGQTAAWATTAPSGRTSAPPPSVSGVPVSDQPMNGPADTT
jgi:hypothetical protein